MCLFPSLFSSILIVKTLDLVYYCVIVDVKNVMIKLDDRDLQEQAPLIRANEIRLR